MIDGEWELLKKDWMDRTITVKQLLKKYSISHVDFYESIHDRLIEDTGFRRRSPDVVRKPKQGTKYYYYENGKYAVMKVIDGKRHRYGKYDTELSAKMVVSKLKEVDWDKEELSRILSELNIAPSNRRKPLDSNLYRILYNDYIQCKYTVKEICELRGISHSTWIRYLKEIKKNTDFRRSYGRPIGNPKYYSFHWDDMHFHVNKNINGKTVHFGKYGDEFTTRQVIERLKECDWDKSMLPLIKEELGVGVKK